VFANVDPSKGYKGITAFLVERGFPGFSWARRRTSSASAPRAPASSSWRTARCPEENVLGEVGKGYKIAIETLNEGRIGIGAQMLGLAQGAFDYAMRTCTSASSSGR
jgi:alkylation response protein AidB-like acyl-CoA dehydrogenase